MKINVILVFVVFLLYVPSFAQVVFVPVTSNGIYEFLERMSLKRVITSNGFQRQLTRKEIGEYLRKVEEAVSEQWPEVREERDLRIEGLKGERGGEAHTPALSQREREELEWYKKEFYDEMNPINENYVNDLKDGLLNSSVERRVRPFYYRDTLFTFSFSPSLLLTMGSKAGESYFRRSWGFKMYGDINKNFGFSLVFFENLEKGKTIDVNKQLSSETGTVLSQNENNSIGYSETTGSLLYGNNWITTGLTKEFFTLGSGYRSQLVLSTKSPSFPAIYFRIAPAKWFTYYFMHGWISSRVMDSLATYSTNIINKLRTVEREKYFVMHALQIKPIENLSVTLGETIIYSD
jgi:hypothetical protein